MMLLVLHKLKDKNSHHLFLRRNSGAAAVTMIPESEKVS